MRAILRAVAGGVSLGLVALAAGRGEAADWARSGWYRSNYGPTYNFVPNNYYGSYSYSVPAYGGYYAAPAPYAGYGNYYAAPSYGMYQAPDYSSYYYAPSYGAYQAPGYSSYYYGSGAYYGY